MRTRTLLPLLAAIGVATIMVGCQSKQPELRGYSGFLSTYRNLEPVSDSTLRYIDPSNRLARYEKFLIDPVEVSFVEGAVGAEARPEDLEELKRYMHTALVDAIDDRYEVVSSPAADVAEVRVAITDVQNTMRVFNFQRGGLVIEGEVVDSVSFVQLGALVEASQGRGLRIDRRLEWWSDAKTQMDKLARRFRAFLDAAHDQAG